MKELVSRQFFPQLTLDKSEAFQVKKGEDPLNDSVRPTDSWGGEILPTPGLLTQVAMLFKRDSLGMKRNLKGTCARFIVTSFLSLVIGLIFLNVGSSNTTIGINGQSHFGALLMVIMMSMFGTAQPPLIAFPDERPVFLREYSTDHYSVIAYFLSRLVNEAFLTALQVLCLCVITYFMIDFHLPFTTYYLVNYAMGMASTALAVLIGSSCDDLKTANELLPTLFVPQLLFSGFFVAPSLIPKALRWIQYVCTLTYATRIALAEEFYNCKPDDAAWNRECNRIVEGTGSNPDDVWWYWLALAAYFVVFRVAALIALRKRATF
jgi:ABC-type multidrug transport system permease subunit